MKHIYETRVSYTDKFNKEKWINSRHEIEWQFEFYN